MSKESTGEMLGIGNVTLTPPLWTSQSNNNNTPVVKFLQSELSDRLWQTVPPLLLVIGLTGNLLVMAVLRKMRFTETVALFFFFVMALADITVLMVGLLRYWILYTFDVDLRTLSDAGCKIVFFLTYFSMDLSSWTLVAVTVERCLVIKFPLRAKSIVTVKRARVVIILIICFLTLINGYLLFTQHIQDDSCGSFEEDGTVYFFDENIFVWIDFLMLSLLPFSIMLACNIAIVSELRANVSRHENLAPAEQIVLRKRNSMNSITLMLLAVNFVFLICTVPISVYFIVDTFLMPQMNGDPYIQAQMDLAWTIVYLIQYFSYTVNFYLYVVRGKRFREAFWRLLRRMPQTQQTSYMESMERMVSRRLTAGEITIGKSSYLDPERRTLRRQTIAVPLNGLSLLRHPADGSIVKMY